MKTLKQLLAAKTRPLAVVAPTDSVYHALTLMAQHDVGALLVLEGEQLVGIFSERDYARKVALKGLASSTTEVREIMTSDVLCANLQQSVMECMGVMTTKHIRHLPVLEGDQLVGVLFRLGQEVSLRTNPRTEAHHDLLTDWVDRWVRDLRKELLEVAV